MRIKSSKYFLFVSFTFQCITFSGNENIRMERQSRLNKIQSIMEKKIVNEQNLIKN